MVVIQAVGCWGPPSGPVMAGPILPCFLAAALPLSGEGVQKGAEVPLLLLDAALSSFLSIPDTASHSLSSLVGHHLDLASPPAPTSPTPPPTSVRTAFAMKQTLALLALGAIGAFGKSRKPSGPPTGGPSGSPSFSDRVG